MRATSCRLITFGCFRRRRSRQQPELPLLEDWAGRRGPAQLVVSGSLGAERRGTAELHERHRLVGSLRDAARVGASGGRREPDLGGALHPGATHRLMQLGRLGETVRGVLAVEVV